MSIPLKTEPYFEAVERFLRALNTLEDVHAVAMIALVGDPETANVLADWNCGPFEKTAMAGILNLAAARQYIEINDAILDTDDAMSEEDEANEEDSHERMD